MGIGRLLLQFDGLLAQTLQTTAHGDMKIPTVVKLNEGSVKVLVEILKLVHSLALAGVERVALRTLDFQVCLPLLQM